MASRKSPLNDPNLISRVRQVNNSKTSPLSTNFLINFVVSRLAVNSIDINSCIFFCRVQYLDENVHKTYVDVDEMTQSLMGRYQEYSRRKLSPFRILVVHGKKLSSKLSRRIFKRLIFTLLSQQHTKLFYILMDSKVTQDQKLRMPDPTWK